MNEDCKKIIDHISRLEGQLAMVKAELKKSEPDCDKASDTLFSASRSFASLRQKFTDVFLKRHFISSVSLEDQARYEKLMALMKG
jgi:DNA-binding FrmR family transcriptional regulator